MLFRSAVELSYIPENGQELIFNICKDTSNDKKMFMKIDTKRAALLRKAFQDNPEISRNEVIRLFSDKPKKRAIKINPEIYSRYFKEETDETEIIEVIEKALEYFFDENT